MNASLSFAQGFQASDNQRVTSLLNRLSDVKEISEEVHAYLRERASIEDDFAKRLSKLAKSNIARAEIGPMRAVFDVLKDETRAMAMKHTEAANELFSEVVEPYEGLADTIKNKRRHIQAHGEKVFRQKIQHEQEVHRAKEKLTIDSHKVNGYRAQQNLLIGRELEKNNNKLEKAQATCFLATEDYNRALDTLDRIRERWEKEWRQVCDDLQKLEEDRIEYTKTYLWAFANAFSRTCVSDDESCEKLRTSLERCQAADCLAQVLNCPERSEFRMLDRRASTPSAPMLTRATVPSGASNFNDGQLISETEDAVNAAGTNTFEEKSRSIVSRPLDGITQLCHRDLRSATGSTGCARSRSNSPAMSSQCKAQNLDAALLKVEHQNENTDASSAHGLRMVQQEFIDDCAPIKSATSLAARSEAKHLKTSRGTSMFDILSPSRSRSRPSSRNQSRQGGRSTEGDRSPIRDSRSFMNTLVRAPTEPNNAQAQRDVDAVSIALERLQRTGSRQNRWPTSSVDSVLPSGESEKTNGQNKRTSISKPVNSAYESRYSQPDYRPQSSQPLKSEVRTVAPGDLRRSPSPAGDRSIISEGHMTVDRVWPADALSSVPDSNQGRGHTSTSRQVADLRPDSRTYGYAIAKQTSVRTTSPESARSASNRAGPESDTGRALRRSTSRSSTRNSLHAQHDTAVVRVMTQQRTAVALYDYQAAIPEEIGFCAGDMITILETRPDGWWVGKLVNTKNPRQGLVPSNFFRAL